tara:strand:+ start:9071 stop:9358 length:288 start_codon:yes stop_codon:yes gene_type:complete
MHNDYFDSGKHGVTGNDHDNEDHPVSSDHVVNHVRALYVSVSLDAFIAITAQPKFTDAYLSETTETLAINRALRCGYALHTITGDTAILEKKLTP